MVPTLKAEFKKLFTVRSTYLMVLLALVVVGIFSFYGAGFKDAESILRHPQLPQQAALFLAGTINQMASFIAIFGGILALLLITHEYRYNTITYTLTASNSRSRVLASKLIAIFTFVFGYAILLAAYGFGMILLGLAFSHNTLPHQDINYLTYFGKLVFYAESFALVGLLFGVLIRNQVGAFATFFIVPGTLESLLNLLLKHNSVYLPFTAVDQVIQSPVISGAPAAHRSALDVGYLSPLHGAEVFLAYLVVGWIVGWYLFLRRDAT